MAAPPRNEFIIVEDELRKLPQEAQMAFAARMALRIIPCLGYKGHFDWEGAKDTLQIYEKAIASLVSGSITKNWREIEDDLKGPAARLKEFGDPVETDTAAAISEIYYNNLSSAIRYITSVFEKVIPGKRNLQFVENAIRNDFEYLQQLSMTKPGVTPLTLERFYSSHLWAEGSSRDWQEIENNFQKALGEIGFPELFEHYTTGGHVYLPDEIRQEPEQVQKATPEMAADTLVEEAEEAVTFDIPPYLSSSVFSIHTHRVEPALGVEKQASIIAGLLENFQDEKGQFVGIFGQWGRGKTYFWEQVRKYLGESERKLYKMAEFQAWKYQDTPASWAYLYETLAGCYYDEHKWIGKVNLALKRGHWKKPLYALLSSIALDVIAHFLIPSVVGFGYLIFGTSVIWNYVVKKEYSTRAVDIFHKLTKKVSFEGYLGTQAEIQKEMIILFKTWFPDPKKKKLLLFVDDIDRCDETRIIQIVDAIRVMLEDEELVRRLVVVAAVDERILMRAIRNKYYDLVFKSRLGTIDERKNQLNALTREYMDKLFITGIKLPQLTAPELKQYLFKLAKKLRVRPKLKETLEKEAPKEEVEEPIPAGETAAPVIGSNENDNEQNIETGTELPAEKESLKEPEEYDLTNEELEVIQETLLDLPRSATPRQIRIFTYRYMMAIRLFQTTSRFESLHFEKGIFNIEENRLLAYMILEFGLLKSVHELIDIKKDLFAANDENVTFITMGKSFTRTKEYLRQLFEVLEMVIAY